MILKALLPCLLVLAGGTALAADAPARPAVPVTVGKAVKRDLQTYLEGLGTVQAYNTVSIRPQVDGQLVNGSATGDGPVDACFNAIREVFAHDATLKLFSVGAVTDGTDAQARVTVRLEEGGKMVDGQGSDTDTIVASARAYVHALNKLLVKRVRTEPQALSA